MVDNHKQMDLNEFRDIGYLHEANRIFFHPLGLALQLNINSDTLEPIGLSIQDVRDDPEGIIFERLDHNKIDNITKEFIKRKDARIKLLGYWIQLP